MGEYFLFAGSVILVVLLQFALIGGALAGGAWVVWRFLEGRYDQPRSASISDRPVAQWVFIGLLLLGAAAFAFGPRPPQPVDPQFALLSFIPFLVLAAAVSGAVWLVQKALR